jgi:hypothetical protein
MKRSNTPDGDASLTAEVREVREQLADLRETVDALIDRLPTTTAKGSPAARRERAEIAALLAPGQKAKDDQRRRAWELRQERQNNPYGLTNREVQALDARTRRSFDVQRQKAQLGDPVQIQAWGELLAAFPPKVIVRQLVAAGLRAEGTGW